MNSGLRSILFLGIAAGACLAGYVAGHDRAEAEGKAALNALRVSHEEDRRMAADAYGKAVADALRHYRDEVTRADALAVKLADQDRTHAAETSNLRRQIGHATKGSTCTLNPDVVRLLNEAAGAGLPDPALPGGVCATGADGNARAGAASAAGLLDQFNRVTEADLAAWFIAYARRTRWLEQRLAAWQELHRNRRQATAGGNNDAY